MPGPGPTLYTECRKQKTVPQMFQFVHQINLCKLAKKANYNRYNAKDYFTFIA